MERQIGEIFQDGEVTLKVIESEYCKGCYYDDDNNLKICNTKLCTSNERSDETSVIFVKQ